MSTRNLDKMMTPGSVVAIGASARPGSLGEAVTRNLLAGGFQGEIKGFTAPELGVAHLPLDANISPVRIQDKLTVVQ